MNALIVANGTPLSQPVLSKLAAMSSLIIAADGGANTLANYELVPHIIIGDGDSITPATRQVFVNVPLLIDHSQNTTDLEKSLHYCCQQDVRTVTIAQVLHGEADHVFGALSAMAQFSDRLQLQCFDEHSVLTVICASSTFVAQPGDRISLLPLPLAEGICTQGLQYPLTNESLGLGQRDGIRNVTLQANFSVTLTQGVLGVLHPHYLV